MSIGFNTMMTKSIAAFRERSTKTFRYGNTAAALDGDILLLYSYATPIVVIDREHKTRLVDSYRYSNTTNRHTRAFLQSTNGMPELNVTLNINAPTRPTQSIGNLLLQINDQLAIIRSPRRQLKTKQYALRAAQNYMHDIDVLVERYSAPTGAEVEKMKLILGTDGEVARVMALTALLNN